MLVTSLLCRAAAFHPFDPFSDLVPLQSKPLPIRWSRYYVDQIKYDVDSGRRCSHRWVDEAVQIMGGSEGLTALQELILDGDISTAMYQIHRLVDLEDHDDSEDDADSDAERRLPMAQSERSILHYAALTGQVDMCRRLLEETPFLSQINEGDLVTGFSPLHIASFVQNPTLVFLFLTHGANIDFTDNYGATMVDYLKMQGRIPSKIDSEARKNVSIRLLPANFTQEPSPTLLKLNIDDFIQQTRTWISKPIEDKAEKVISNATTSTASSGPSDGHFTWTSQYRINDDYVEELMFGGYEAPTQKDAEFRTKFLSRVSSDPSGESGLVVAYINDEVGYGCYAAKPFTQGDYIVTYMGQFIAKRSQKDRSYSMSSSLDSIVLDASQYRNLSAFINHSDKSNAEAQGIFEGGVDRIVITAKRAIPIGQQICIDYGADYFRVKGDKSGEPKKSGEKTQPKPQKERPQHSFQDVMAGLESGSMPSTLPQSVIQLLSQ